MGTTAPSSSIVTDMTTSDSESAPVSRRIVQLDESVVNRIAAGEIIIHPANALKEMLENSIDAHSTMIDILVKDGGLKLLQISDNGTGIGKEDMDLLCERFATSKLRSFEDLNSIATYGFRGEALASISHIARLSVVTKTKGSPLAYKAFYSNGKLADQNFNASSSAASVAPRPIAGKQGTTIVVEDLFYNAPARAKATKSKNEEFIKILDVVGRYAVHSPVGFSCKKFGDSHQALTTRPKLSLKDRIRTVYGSSIANELMEFEMDELERGDTEFGLLECLGAVTNSNYINKKKQQPVIFINDRSVACDSLKRSLMSIYAYFLPKGNQPFMYLNLKINPAHVDVNVHPTKREVRFLNEDEIIDVIGAKIHSMLSKVDTSRTFKTQSVLMRNKRSGEGGELVSISAEPVQELQQLQPTKKYRQENKLVRTDSKQLKLHTFMKREVPLRSGERNLYLEAVVENVEDATSDRVEVNLSSILRLTEDLVESTHKGLTEVFNGSTYVGIVDELRRLCSFQFGVKLYICDYASILNEFYYQIALGEFNNFGEFTLLEPLLVEEIIGPLSNMASTSIDVIVDRIVAMREMLEEYFNLKFDQLGQLYSLPMILKTIEPQISKLPYFIYRLGTNINYENEMECLEGILREIALLYIPEAIPVDEVDVEQRELNTVKRNELNHELENHIFPLLRQKFIATGKTVEDVMEIADLPGLYKVFERC